MKCNYCGSEAEWVDNAEIYGRRYGKSYMAWLCRPCDAYVGCHCNTEKPLGTLANKKLRMLRKQAKEMFINKKLKGRWGRNYSQKDKAYQWLARVMGLDADDAHFGCFGPNQCKKVMNLLKD